jgi:uncharacterized protein YydD (DUF2326 family)
MFLKNLTISDGSSVIRDISFRKGLNLIVDETDTRDTKKSGNNVGKTTVLRLIDYCFGASGTNIFRDPEFKRKADTRIEQFLKGRNIVIALTLTEDIENPSASKLTVRRNFLNRKDKILEINGEQQTVREFPNSLKKLIFRSEYEKPKLRSIIAKNIRDEKNRLVNTLRVLSPYATFEDYEAVYLFWLGIDVEVNARKQLLQREHRIEEGIINRLKREASLSQIEQSLIVVNRSIAELTVKRDGFEVNENYETELKRLNKTKRDINRLATLLSNLEMRRELISESEASLRGETSSVDKEKIQKLYNEANIVLPQLHKTFEETVAFHNQMVQMKLEYITKEIPALDSQRNAVKQELAEMLTQEQKLSAYLRKSGLVEDLEKIVSEMNSAFERKGALEEQKRLWEASINTIKSIEDELHDIDKHIESKDDLIQERVTEFNKYFSALSQQLYGESFVLSADKEEEGYELNISSLAGNLGTGKKKGQIAAFDLAYIQFADSVGLRCLHFILQDQIENVHANQITSLLTEIVSSVNCQYVLPVLRDKLPEDIDISSYEILSLSQSDKLFRL